MVEAKFLKKISILNSEIKKLSLYTEKYIDLCSTKTRDVLSEEKEANINKSIEAVDDKFKDESQRIQEEIKKINDENTKIKNVLGEESSDYQIRNLQWQKITQDLKNEINGFRHQQLKHKKEESDRLKNQYMIVHKDASESEVDRIINEEEGPSLLQRAIAGGSSSSKRQLNQMKERNNKIRALAKRIDELLHLISQLQEMVNQSGNVINKIEIKMAKTEATTDIANKDLQTAYSYQVSRMWIKRIIYLIIGILLLLGIIWLGSKLWNTVNTKNKTA